jgi:hypothetical protein
LWIYPLRGRIAPPVEAIPATLAPAIVPAADVVSSLPGSEVQPELAWTAGAGWMSAATTTPQTSAATAPDRFFAGLDSNALPIGLGEELDVALLS